MKEYWMMWVGGMKEITFGHGICGEQWGGKPAKILEKIVWGSGNSTSKVLRLLGERMKRLKKKSPKTKTSFTCERTAKKIKALKAYRAKSGPKGDAIILVGRKGNIAL